MRKFHVGYLTIILIMSITISGCASAASDKVFKSYDSNNFKNSTIVNNQWLPMKPGMQRVLEGFTVEDNEQIPHRVEMTTTGLTKVIDEVRTVVVWILDFSDEELIEAELAFFAQDNDGNVWRMGEYPEEYENGEFVDAPAWIHGIDGAHAGIAMQANPKLNTADYPQGWAPGVDWTDRGQVDQIGQQLCVPFGCYENVLVIAENSQSEPNAFQLKYYAPGIGNISVGWRGEDATQETLELVELVQLSQDELEEIHTDAFKLEAHAYKVSDDVYAQTFPLEGP